MDPPEEAALIARVLAGDGDAFAPLVREHQGRVLALCLSLLGGLADAEEAAQEAFLKAYRRLDRFAGGSSLGTWLYRIAYNHCLDELRKRKARRAESWEELAEREGPRLERLLAAPESSAAEDQDLIRRVLAQLPQDYRTALVLREVQGLTYEEIAAATGWSLDSVKARLRRARGALADRLRHFLGPGSVQP